MGKRNGCSFSSTWSKRRGSGSSPGSNLIFDVIEHARVNAMDHPIAIHPPIPFRRHVDLVPRAAFETRAAAWQRNQSELTPARSQKPLEMRRMHAGING